MRGGLALAWQHESGDFESFVAGEGLASKVDILGQVLEGFTAATARSEPVKPPERTVPLFKVGSRSREYRLARPLALRVYPLGSLTVAENESLQMLAYGKNLQGALAGFAEAFDVLYQEVADSDPSVLSENAQALRCALRDLVLAVS